MARKYTHKKNRNMPMEHGSIADEQRHEVWNAYKTKRKRKKRIGDLSGEDYEDDDD